MIKLIKIDEDSRVPKYKQIVDSILQNIANGNLKINQKIPSINSFSEEFYMSRDTVEKAYKRLLYYPNKAWIKSEYFVFN